MQDATEISSVETWLRGGQTLKLPNLVGAPYWDPPPKRLAHIVAVDSQSSSRIQLLTPRFASAADVIDIGIVSGRFLI